MRERRIHAADIQSVVGGFGEYVRTQTGEPRVLVVIKPTVQAITDINVQCYVHRQMVFVLDYACNEFVSFL